jgi:hypothetical protein
MKYADPNDYVRSTSYRCAVAGPPPDSFLQIFRLEFPGGSFYYRLCVTDGATVGSVRTQFLQIRKVPDNKIAIGNSETHVLGIGLSSSQMPMFGVGICASDIP